MSRKDDLAMASHCITQGVAIFRLLGDFATGLVALEAELQGKEITAEFVSLRLNGLISDDTARRRLTLMVDMGVLKHRKQGRTKFYRLDSGIAVTAMDLLRRSI